MSQRHCRHALHMIVCNSATAFKRSERTCSAHDRQLTTMSINLKIGAKLRDPFQHRPFDSDLSETRACACDSFAKLFLVRFIRLTKSFTISIVTFTTLDDVDAVL